MNFLEWVGLIACIMVAITGVSVFAVLIFDIWVRNTKHIKWIIQAMAENQEGTILNESKHIAACSYYVAGHIEQHFTA